MRCSWTKISFVTVAVSALWIGFTPPSAKAQATSATSPTTRRAGTRPAARVWISKSPRDRLPFTNESLSAINPALPTLFITGDSTAATGDPDHRGWAAILSDYFDLSKVNLVNQAQGGARFNSYMPQRWPAVVNAIKPGDFVVIQFGQNSGPLPGIGPETQPSAGVRGGAPSIMHTHGWYLQKFIADVRQKQGIPIVMTLTLRNYWKDGKVERLKEIAPGKGGMSDWSREVAALDKALLVDHSNIIGDRYDLLGQEKVKAYFAGAEYLHTDTEGAIVNCEAFIAGLKGIPDMPLVDVLNDKGKAIGPWHGSGN